MFKGVVFDLDGTLYDYAANHVIAMKSLCACAEERLGVGESEFLDAYEEAKILVKARLTEAAAQHNRLLFCQTALELLEINPFHHALELCESYWSCFLEHMVPYDGTLDMLKELKEKGIRTAICTDMTAQIQYRKIRRLGFADLIDKLVTSEEVGAEKPSPLMFQRALKKLNLKPKETAYIGDSLERDVEGSSACGLHAFWFVADREIPEDAPYPKLRSYQREEWRKMLELS